MLGNPDSGRLPLQENINENKFIYADVPGVKEVGCRIKDSGFLTDVGIGKISGHESGQLSRIIYGVINYCDIHVALPFYDLVTKPYNFCENLVKQLYIMGQQIQIQYNIQQVKKQE